MTPSRVFRESFGRGSLVRAFTTSHALASASLGNVLEPGCCDSPGAGQAQPLIEVTPRATWNLLTRRVELPAGTHTPTASRSQPARVVRGHEHRRRTASALSGSNPLPGIDQSLGNHE
ncbi:hypothetical protein PhiH1_455 [Halobacterium phage phiH]|uniref:Uncharacterized protein n=1 Tax=Halobacterium phage phiH TaxID=169684 RepID=A0A3G1ZL40_BPPHH|nr:hypothetical protein JR051_gp92 [Halobacterium phage phiH]AYM00337.1 hypothetical protein PhiH1_455 [Halobacterium phage phiH]